MVEMASHPPQPGKPSPIRDIRQLRMNSYDERDFKGRLSEEYKILQDKIDKIGAFRFTIKGWSITAVIAASAAASGKGLATAFTISLGLVLMLIFFFLLEYEQVRCSRLFGDRAGRLEDAFKKISLGKGREVYADLPVPHTAHELVWAGHRTKSFGRGPQYREGTKAWKGWVEKWHASRQAHFGFYVVLIALALAPLLSQHSEIGAKWKGLRESAIHTRPEAH